MWKTFLMVDEDVRTKLMLQLKSTGKEELNK
jgi:hypothetical protein